MVKLHGLAALWPMEREMIYHGEHVTKVSHFRAAKEQTKREKKITRHNSPTYPPKA